MQCPKCKEEGQTQWGIFGDSPETCADDHRVPRWSLYTICCRARVGEIHRGYSPPDGSQRIWPLIGIG